MRQMDALLMHLLEVATSNPDGDIFAMCVAEVVSHAHSLSAGIAQDNHTGKVMWGQKPRPRQQSCLYVHIQ